MKSITKHLCLSQLILQFAVCALFCFALYLYIEHVLTRDFTRNLEEQSQTLAQLVETSSEHGEHRGAHHGRRERGRRDIPRSSPNEPDPESIDFTEFDSQHATTSYFILNPGGRIVKQSQSASWDEVRSIPITQSQNTSGQVNLADGRTIGFAQTPVQSRRLNEYENAWSVIVVRDQKQITHTLHLLIQGLVVCGVTLLVVSAALSIWNTRNGLAPLKKIASDVDALGSEQLDYRFDTDDLPSELSQITGKLNDLLGRLEQAFLRERSFAGSAAHELRTPLAELKAIAQVGAGWTTNSTDTPSAYFQDAESIILRMESLLAGLHTLIDPHPGKQNVNWTDVDLESLVDSCARALDSNHSGKQFKITSPEGVHVLADSNLLTGIITNLVGNALEYANEQSSISCDIAIDGQSVELRISNRCDDLHESDVAQMLDAFWRKDASRTGTRHQGLGLAIAQTYAGCINCKLTARLDDRNRVTLSLTGLELV